MRCGRAWVQGVQKWCSASAEDGQCSLSTSPFQSPVSGTQTLSPPLPPPSPSRRPSASLGWISSIPKQLLLLPIPLLMDTQLGISALGWSRDGAVMEHPPFRPLKTSGCTPVGNTMPPAARSKGTEGSASSSCGATGSMWLQGRVTQLILAGKSIRFSLNNSEGAFSSVPMTLQVLKLGTARPWCVPGFQFSFCCFCSSSRGEEVWKSAGGNGKVQ